MLNQTQHAKTKQPTTSPFGPVLWSSVLGTAVEFYDFIIYGTASAIIFKDLFFSSMSPVTGIIAAFGTYGVGFFARPLGGLVFGHFGDRIGRKAVLSTTILLTGGGTFLIGCLPTYAQVGILAPVGLVVLRILQGFGLGGERAGAILMVLENSPSKHRGYYGSLVQLGYPLGAIAATGIFAIVTRLPRHELMSWGWRVPFLLSSLLICVAFFIRFRLNDPPVFQTLKTSGAISSSPFMELITAHKRVLVAIIFLPFAEIAYSIVVTVFAISYLTNSLQIPKNIPLDGVFLAHILQLFTIPLVGYWSDRIGRKKTFMLGCVFVIFACFPVFTLFASQNHTLILTGIVASIAIGQSLMFGVEATWASELFSSRLRYSGASFGLQTGAAFSGGLTPIIVSSAFELSGATWTVSLFVIVMGLASLLAASCIPETAYNSIK